jgi:xanthine dehydrogenase YagS FAD-binding subunit
MRAFDYAIAETREAALAAAAEGWTVKAGGVDLIDHLKERIGRSPRVVGIHALDELRGVRAENRGLRIGPLTTLRELGESEAVRAQLPALAQSAEEAATPQVRARATVGGNLCQRPRCWYYRSHDYPCLKKGGGTCFAVEGENQFHALYGEGPCHIVHPSNIAPVLVAVGAQFDLEKAGESRTVAAADFFVLPNANHRVENVLAYEEIITAVRVPAMPDKAGYAEVRHKQSFDWPLAACAAARHGGKWHVILGAVAPMPWRSEHAEHVLQGVDPVDAATAERAAEAALEGAAPMSKNAWRLALVRAAVRRALMRAEGQEAV